jgi:hypothetical protein
LRRASFVSFLPGEPDSSAAKSGPLSVAKQRARLLATLSEKKKRPEKEPMEQHPTEAELPRSEEQWEEEGPSVVVQS